MDFEANMSLLEDIKAIINSNIDLKKELSDEEIEEIITNAVFEKSRDTYLSVADKQFLINYIFNAMRRLDIIQPLLDDPAVTEIMVNGPEDIFIEREGRISKLCP